MADRTVSATSENLFGAVAGEVLVEKSVSDLCTIICGDSLEKLVWLSAESVQLIVTSPPYDHLRRYGSASTPEWDFEGIAKELFRVLCDGGILCWNIGDSVIDGSETLTSCKQKIFFREEAGFRIHDTMIWKKPNFANPESARYHQLFEYVFVLSKGRPRCFNPIKDKPNVQAGAIGALGRNSYMKRDGERSTRPTYVTQDFGMRGNVWEGNSRGQEEMCSELPHPAMMPKWLAHDLIISWSNPGDIVADPFIGSGTTGKEALETGRKFIGFDINPDYCELARKTCSQATQGFALA